MDYGCFNGTEASPESEGIHSGETAGGTGTEFMNPVHFGNFTRRPQVVQLLPKPLLIYSLAKEIVNLDSPI
jgi:hypothetical protein